MAKRKGKADDEHGALAPHEDAWGLGRKAVEIPSAAALESMDERELLRIAKEHHAQGLAIYRDVLPYGVVVGLCLRAAKGKVQAGGTSWTKYLEREWPDFGETTSRKFIGTAETYLQLVSAHRGAGNLQRVMATMAQAARAIGCAELAKPAAREPRKPKEERAPDPVINTTYTIKPPAPELEPPPLDPPAPWELQALPPPVCSNCKQPASEGRPLDRLGTAFDPTGRATAWRWTHVGCLHPQDARLARERAGVDQEDEEVGRLDGVEPGEPYGTDDEAEPDLPDEEEGPTLRGALEERGLLWGPAKSGALNRFDVVDPVSNEPLLEDAGLMDIWAWLKDQDEVDPTEGEPEEVLAPASSDLGPACTCGHVEDEHRGPLGTCEGAACFCDGFDGGIDVPGALSNLWAAYKEASPQGRPLILRAIELLGDDPADAAAIDQEDQEDEEELLEEEAQASAPGPRPKGLEEEVRAKLGPAVLSTEHREDLAARLAANPLDVEAIRVADGHGEVGGLIRPAQRYWALLRCAADELDRDARLERIGVPPQERIALLDVRHDMQPALDRLRGLVVGELVGPAPAARVASQDVSEADLEEARDVLSVNPLDVAAVRVLAYHERWLFPSLHTEALEKDVDPSQWLRTLVHETWRVIDARACHLRPPSLRVAAQAIARDQEAVVAKATALVTERCGDGKAAKVADRMKARKAKTREQHAKAAKTVAKKKGGKK